MKSDTTALDNPIWHALTTSHAALAEGDRLAKRYPVDIGPLSAIKEESSQAFNSLAQLLRPEDISVLFLSEPPSLPASLRLLHCISVHQMICPAPPPMPKLDVPI